MSPGVPYAQSRDGAFRETIGAVLTPENLVDVYGDTAITPLIHQLQRLTFGDARHSPDPRCAIYELPGFKQNLRSGKPSPEREYDGSYSIGSTLGEGEGMGDVKPALQTSTPASALHINETLTCLARLRMLIAPLVVDKFELDIGEFADLDNNTFTLGGPAFGATGCQVNVCSRNVSSLNEAFSWQGSWHPDIHDEGSNWTLAVMLLNIPPGYDKWLSSAAANAIYNIHATVIRVAYILYPNQHANRRTAGLRVSPPLGFGNIEKPVPSSAVPLNYCLNAQPILGSPYDRTTRLSREVVAMFYNFLEHAGIETDLEPNEMLSHLYASPNGHGPIHPRLFPRTIRDSPEYFIKMRGYLKWYRAECAKENFNLKRYEVSVMQVHDPLSYQIYLQHLRLVLSKWSQPNNGPEIWRVVREGQNEPEDLEAGTWMRIPQNAALLNAVIHEEAQRQVQKTLPGTSLQFAPLPMVHQFEPGLPLPEGKFQFGSTPKESTHNNTPATESNTSRLDMSQKVTRTSALDPPKEPHKPDTPPSRRRGRYGKKPPKSKKQDSSSVEVKAPRKGSTTAIFHDNVPEYHVSKILTHRFQDKTGEIEWKVRWAGYSALHDTWEPYISLRYEFLRKCGHLN
ncbi:hypothetical protein PUNSTDRAFT_42840 [Punctularia strigosozonata HHB-11173 SS5]|uniref:uncharacterized protein n=1 Tax=Punctularia strigosozonata (strain HHB-11173) TaxID=741275 RepID=UPI00044184DC|nr:uncharacterized protein PUNSTDRAFT_42840 [Punctularia strigosozonata HHB-11173 SS5]EIN11645.1 hypothetical protein PUNSTDRAFT_42840 [Punctularia strigosozonata HHB-11173 SS5]